VGIISLSFFVSHKQNILQNRAAEPKIIGGVDVLFGEYPSVALIGDYCSGVLINSRWILTAAHCLESRELPKVAVGIVNRNEFDVHAIQSLSVVLNPNYKEDGSSNDIGLILLSKDVEVNPLPKLPQPGKDEGMYTIDNVATTVGWGCTKNVTKVPTDDQLLKACSQIKGTTEQETMSQCDLTAKPSCGYNAGCHVCMPLNRSDINYKDCTAIQNKIKSVNNDDSIIIDSTNIVDLIPGIKFSDTLQRALYPIASPPILLSHKSSNTFYFGYKDQRSLSQTTCYGDSGAPIFYSQQNELYILGIEGGRTSSLGRKGLSIGAKVIDYTDWIKGIINNPDYLVNPKTLLH